MKFTHKSPFRTPHGNVVTMKAKVTMRGKVHIECYEDTEPYTPADLQPMTTAEYQEYKKKTLHKI